MKKLITIGLLSGIFLFFFASTTVKTIQSKSTNEFDFIHNGDIVFQSTESAQCNAVRLATHSQFSHCGIAFIENNTVMIYEAVQPVKKTPLKKWLTHGNNNYYEIKRLKKADSLLTEQIIENMKKYATTLIGKDYDIYFEWSDEKIYCSEYVWKIYKNVTGIEVGTLQKLKNFDLSSPQVKQILKERYGNTIPFNETVISPEDIYKSPLLESVKIKQ